MITDAEWSNASARVTNEMALHIAKYSTALTMSEEPGYGTAWGSGTYIKGPTNTWILTAEHVISNVPAGGRLAHLPMDGGDYNAAFGLPLAAAWPIDSAGLPIYPKVDFLPPAERILDPSLIAKSYAPEETELLFWYGFPGYLAERNDPRTESKLHVSRFNHLNIPGKPMVSQEIAKTVHLAASNFVAEKHVAIHYPAIAKRATDGEMVAVPNAAGMSGSALWDTKFVSCIKNGTPWQPELAQVCGVIWAVFDNPETVFATKIQHVRAALPEMF